MSPRPVVARAAELMLFLALAIALTWPLALGPATTALGAEEGDIVKHLWTLGWSADALRSGSFSLSTDLLDFPDGVALYPIEPVSGLIAALSGLSPVPASNLLVLLNLTLTGVCGAWLGRLVSRSDSGGRFAGLVLQASSPLAASIAVGVGELQHLWLLPLGLGLLLRADRLDRPRDWALLAAALAGAVLASFYLGLFLALGVLACAATQLGQRPSGRRLLRLTLTAAAALLLCLPAIRAFSGTYVLPEEIAPAVLEPAFARLDPLDLLLPGGAATDAPAPVYGWGRSLGIVATLLALLGLVRARRAALPLVAVTATGLLVALGGELVLAGSSTGIPLPFHALNSLLDSIAAPLNFPVRALALVVTALSALGALAVRRGGITLGLLAALELTLLSAQPFPWPRTTPPDLSELALLAEHDLDGPARHGIVDLSLALAHDATGRRLSLLGQLVHHHPISSTPFERLEVAEQQSERFLRALPLYAELDALVRDQRPGLGRNHAPSLSVLRQAGFGELMLHPVTLPEHLRARVTGELGAILGEPLVAGATTLVWAIPEQRTSGEERLRWWTQHQERLANLPPRLPSRPRLE